MKYSNDWKQETNKWVQKHKHFHGKPYCSIHYIQNEIEYSCGEYPTEESTKEDLKNNI